MDERAGAILDAAIKAIGGKKRLARLQDLVVRSQYSSFTDEIRYRAPNRISRTSNFHGMSVRIGYDGAHSWHIDGEGNVVEKVEGRIAAVQWLFHRIQITLLLPLLDSAESVEYLGRKTVNFFENKELVRKPADVLRVTFDDGWIFRLYFSRETHFLVKSEWRHGTHQTRYVERYYDRYASTRRVKLPRRTYEYNHHNRTFTRVKTEYEVDAGLKRRSFKMPSTTAKKRGEEKKSETNPETKEK